MFENVEEENESGQQASLLQSQDKQTAYFYQNKILTKRNKVVHFFKTCFIFLCEEFWKYMNIVHQSQDIGCVRYCEPSQNKFKNNIKKIRKHF